MKLYIYNTLTRQKEEFVPLMEDPNYKGPQKDFVGVYSCWPTVYRDPHIGNMRAYFFADILRNTLKNICWYPVKYVVNITDVGHLTSDADEGEDKLEKWSKREWISARDVAKKYEERFRKFLKMLNIDDFDVFPKATEHIPEQIQLVKMLEEKWFTYIIENDGVYMDTSKVKDYGKLAKLDIEWLNQGARIENDQKKNKTDFALRKFSPKGEKRQMERDSPRGKWFPWRHIECSAMSSKYLWQQFDIHTGGVDHIPVHHTNEIAQSECWFGVSLRVKYWMHNQFLNLGGKKIAKSEGWLVTVDDLVAKGFSPLDLRYFFMLAHYRNFQDFTLELLEQAKNGRHSLMKKLQGKRIVKEKSEFENDPIFQEALAAIYDDLNTPKLLAVIQWALHSWGENIYAIITRLEERFLKLWLFEEIQEEKIEIPAEITRLADQRREAKKNKDFALADELRNKITAAWFQLKDTKDGYEITKR